MGDVKSDETLAEIKAALQDPNVSIRFTQTFTHGRAVQVYVKSRKVGPFILPPDDGDISDVLSMLGKMAVTA